MTNISTFLSSVSVIDTETTHLDPALAEIVEIAEAHWTGSGWATRSQLMGALGGIPPAASAKNNISNRMIRGLPGFSDCIDEIRQMLEWPGRRYYVAHNAAYDRRVLAEAWKKSGDEEDLALCADDGRWICTWRLSRHILAHDFSDIEYGLNYLRYLLDLPVPDDLKLHRAADDTHLCAILLEHLVDAAIRLGLVDPAGDVGEQLNRLCRSPIIQTTWPLGKHRGKLLAEIPDDYWAWAIDNIDVFREGSSGYDLDLAESVRQMLESRLLPS
jgi:DNA polymerase III epsilon subunit-like protein